MLQVELLHKLILKTIKKIEVKRRKLTLILILTVIANT